MKAGHNKGDPLNISADFLNWAAKAVQSVRNGVARPRPSRIVVPPTTGIMTVKNQSGSNRNRFDVLGIDNALFTPTQNLSQFISRPSVRGVVPQDVHAGRFVVLLDPIRNNGIGRATVSGLCVANVRMNDPNHTTCDVSAGDAQRLHSADSGVATILWAEPLGAYPGNARAYIRIGGGGGGGGNPFGYAVVRSIPSGTGWIVRGQHVVPVDRALGTWDILPDLVDFYTDVIRPRYYQPFVWDGTPAGIREGNILPTRREGSVWVITQHLKHALLAQPVISPITHCQVITG